jgi:chloride channel protein, CIC family
MTEVFGSPISGVLLAVELLLFEFSARSLIPVMFASGSGMAMHIIFLGADIVNVELPGTTRVSDIAKQR